jgi:hypothetical protein
MPLTRNSVSDAIAREQARVARLDKELTESRATLESLRADLSAGRMLLPSTPSTIPSPRAPVTSVEKVALFRSMFRGREDLYPKLWTNAKTGAKGTRPPVPTSGSAASARSLRSSAESVRTKPSWLSRTE